MPDYIDYAARISTSPEFAHIESPLVLDICRAYAIYEAHMSTTQHPKPSPPDGLEKHYADAVVESWKANEEKTVPIYVAYVLALAHLRSVLDINPVSKAGAKVDQFSELVHRVWKETKPSREAQQIRAIISNKLDSGRYSQPDSEFMPDYVSDIADIAAQMAFDKASITPDKPAAVKQDGEECPKCSGYGAILTHVGSGLYKRTKCDCMNLIHDKAGCIKQNGDELQQATVKQDGDSYYRGFNDGLRGAAQRDKVFSGEWINGLVAEIEKLKYEDVDAHLMHHVNSTIDNAIALVKRRAGMGEI